jgi:hypothetical protein
MFLLILSCCIRPIRMQSKNCSTPLCLCCLQLLLASPQHGHRRLENPRPFLVVCHCVAAYKLKIPYKGSPIAITSSPNLEPKNSKYSFQYVSFVPRANIHARFWGYSSLNQKCDPSSDPHSNKILVICTGGSFCNSSSFPLDITCVCHKVLNPLVSSLCYSRTNVYVCMWVNFSFGLNSYLDGNIAFNYILY